MTDQIRTAIEEIRHHFTPWVDLLTAYVATMPPDTAPSPESDGCYNRSYAEHELCAMKRGISALLAAVRATKGE